MRARARLRFSAGPRLVGFGVVTTSVLDKTRAEHRFPAPSSKLCMHVNMRHQPTLRAPLSGTFLQTRGMHVNMRHPVKKKEKKKEFHLDYSNADCGLICAGVNLCWWLYMTRLVLFDLFVTNLLLFEHQQKTAR